MNLLSIKQMMVSNAYEQLFSVDFQLKELRRELKSTTSAKEGERLQNKIEELVQEQTELVNSINQITKSNKGGKQ